MKNNLKIKDMLLPIIIGFVIAMLVNQFAGLALVSGHSMDPTLDDGEAKFINKIIYSFSSPKKGDIVIFYPSKQSDTTFVKRVIAVSGDTIKIHNNAVYVNGLILYEPYLMEEMITPDIEELQVLSGEYFLMGDNRNVSMDSRDFGLIREEQILGKIKEAE